MRAWLEHGPGIAAEVAELLCDCDAHAACTTPTELLSGSPIGRRFRKRRLTHNGGADIDTAYLRLSAFML